MQVRQAQLDDLPRLTEIYNHYVLTTPVTFDVEPYTVERRRPWFEQFASVGRYRLVVATDGPTIIGYAGTTRFRPKPAYETTVESTIYCAPGYEGRGVGALLYGGLFESIIGEDINRIVAGFVLPNPASARLHERFGFKPVGVFTANGRKFGRYWDVAWVEKDNGISVDPLTDRIASARVRIPAMIRGGSTAAKPSTRPEREVGP